MRKRIRKRHGIRQVTTTHMDQEERRITMIRKTVASLAVSALFMALILTTALTAATCLAGDTRGYVPAPADTYGLLFYYRHAAGNEKFSDGNKVAEDFNLQSNIQIFRPVYYTSMASMPVSLQALIPFGDISLDGSSVGNKSFSASGLGDPTILAAIWPISNPETKTWLGFSQWFKMPFGEYDKDRILNMGSNQWAFKTEAGLVKGFGDFYLELSPYAEFYTDNDDYKSESLTLEKDPVFCMETHLSYDINKATLISLDHYYTKGGETSAAGVSQNDETDTHSVQFTFGFNPAPKQKILLQYLQDVSVENGPKTSKFGMRYTYIF